MRRAKNMRQVIYGDALIENTPPLSGLAGHHLLMDN
jgi:hypothetical protein